MAIGDNKVVHDIVITYLTNAGLVSDPKLYAKYYCDAYLQIEESIEDRKAEDNDDFGKGSDFFA